MKDIYVLKSGETVPAKIVELFERHGPYTIEGRRLDLELYQVFCSQGVLYIQCESGRCVRERN
jgi:hypothetical protein